ncbi:hypothetical protein GCM10009716_31660 [Streptomyces sodiiphilus]|uniref:Uncharacterized protein n=1 Tax=Streptomyces sodiiphilus TaxID=226217 RepID=A0ABN2PFS9_9ACTN
MPAFVLLLAADSVPFTVLSADATAGLTKGFASWEASGQTCWEPPDSVIALADDPDAAAEALDPGNTAGGPVRVHQLLDGDHWETCSGPAGADLIGSVLLAATTGRTADAGPGAAPGEPRTLAQARTFHRTVTVLGADDAPGYPREFVPYLARMLASYIVDVSDGLLGYGDETGPALQDDEERGEARAVLSRDDDGSPALRALLWELTADPEAFALLYDALGAYFAHLLERTDAQIVREAPEEWPGHPFGDDHYLLTEGFATLLGLREWHIAAGRIPDGPAFDRQVLTHSTGAHLPFRPTGDEGPGRVSRIADRPAAVPAKQWAVSGALDAGLEPEAAAVWFMSPRDHLGRVLDEWAADRDIPAEYRDHVHRKFTGWYLTELRSIGLPPGR